MSGSGGNRDTHEPSTPIGTAGSKGGKGGGGGATDPCAIVQDAPLNSPNPAVVPGLSVGDRLDVAVTGTPPRRVLEVRTATGSIAGSLTHVGHLQIIRCIDDGNSYQAEVIQKTGGSVIVRVQRT